MMKKQKRSIQMGQSAKRRVALFLSSLIFISALSTLQATQSTGQDQPLELSENVVEEDAQTGQTQENLNNKTTPSESKGDNLYKVIKQGGWIMIPILGMFLLGMTLIIERLIFYYRNRSWEKTAIETILNSKSSKSSSTYREELENELRDESQLYFNDMEKGLNLIHGIGNLAPLVGFFGTVIGMIKAFAAIATAAVVNAKVVAVGIQVALVTTAGGLAVAVFMLIFYHLFGHMVQTQYARVDELVSGLIEKLPSYSQKD